MGKGSGRRVPPSDAEKAANREKAAATREANRLRRKGAK